MISVIPSAGKEKSNGANEESPDKQPVIPSEQPDKWEGANEESPVKE